jgi:hypothetical protein
MKIHGGWSQTPNEIIAAMPLMHGSELRCTLVLIRETYGYHRRQVKLTYEDFRRQTGIRSDQTLTDALKAVDSRGFFLRTGGQSNWMIVDRCLHEEKRGSMKSEAGGIANGSSREANSSDTSIIEESGSLNSLIIKESGSTNSSIIEVPPLYKERSLTGKEREGERKDKRQPHPKAPIPRTDEQRELADHPAAEAWLEAGLDWPGWQRMGIITLRLGEEPQIEALQRARELWLLAGYRPGNIGGILDWYEALCHDGTWRPFGKRTGESARRPDGGEGVTNPTMAMLQRIKEERMDGR